MGGRTRQIAGAIVGLLAVTTTAACGDDGTAGAAEQLRFAVTDIQGLEELQREFGAFVSTFEEASGLDIEFFAVNDRAAAAAALAADRVDIVFTGPAEYVVIRERTGAEPIVAISRPGYRSCIYTRADSEITELADLAGATVAMSDIGSTSGHLGPSQLLVDAGLDPLEDLEVLTVGDTVHQALVRGDVDAVGIGCHDYEEFMESEDPADYGVIAEGDPLPPDVLIAHEDLDEETVEQIRTTFTEHWDDLLAAMLEGDDNQKYSDAELVEIEDADYDVVRSMYRAIGVEDFDEFVGD